eukprot:Hpha_TRINITY_DN12634_c0_g2::TRINITY_DN12634_c0_g2_i1::g.49680::m.49680
MEDPPPDAAAVRRGARHSAAARLRSSSKSSPAATGAADDNCSVAASAQMLDSSEQSAASAERRTGESCGQRGGESGAAASSAGSFVRRALVCAGVSTAVELPSNRAFLGEAGVALPRGVRCTMGVAVRGETSSKLPQLRPDGDCEGSGGGPAAFGRQVTGIAMDGGQLCTSFALLGEKGHRTEEETPIKYRNC